MEIIKKLHGDDITKVINQIYYSYISKCHVNLTGVKIVSKERDYLKLLFIEGYCNYSISIEV